MPFAYAGTRRRRNRDRRRNHETPESATAAQDRTDSPRSPAAQGSADAREERDPTAARRTTDPDTTRPRDGQGGEVLPGVDS